MKLEAFFEKFELIADAPNAVARMRELLIHLAVNGKLVPNDPKEDPVALSAFEPPSEQAEFPPNWRCGLLGDAFTFEYGENLPAAKRTETGEYPVYGSNGIVGTHDTYLTKEPAIIVGRKGSAGALNIADGPSWTTDVAYFVIPPTNVDLRYTFYLFSTLHLDKLGKGIKPGLSRKDAYVLPIALPPLAEQKRIVAKVDELMALCDRLEAQQQERDTRHAALVRASLARFTEAPTPANLEFLFHPSYDVTPADLRKAILTLAVQGKLVPQDPNDEPAEHLIERVSAALPNKKSENPFLTRIEASITDESEYELPYGWAWLPLGHVGVWATGCGFPSQYQGETDKEFLFCKVSDMNLPGNEIEIRTTVHTIDAAVMKKIRARANPAGTVIFPKIGGAIATHKRRLVIKPTIIDNNCSGIQPVGLTDDGWLLLLMRNLDLTKYQSGTSVPAVSQRSLDPIRIGLPPLAEQRRIVAKVEQLMALVDELEQQLAASRATAEKLLTALVAEITSEPSPVGSNGTHTARGLGEESVRRGIRTMPLLSRKPQQRVAFPTNNHSL